jgi:hypothetical protein
MVSDSAHTSVAVARTALTPPTIVERRADGAEQTKTLDELTVMETVSWADIESDHENDNDSVTDWE